MIRFDITDDLTAVLMIAKSEVRRFLFVCNFYRKNGMVFVSDIIKMLSNEGALWYNGRNKLYIRAGVMSENFTYVGLASGHKCTQCVAFGGAEGFYL